MLNPFQIKTRKLLDQIASNVTGVELDDLLKSIDSELKMPLRMTKTGSYTLAISGLIATNDIVDNSGSPAASGAGNGRNRVIQPIGATNILPFAFTGATITYPSTNNNNITQTTAGGSLLLNITVDTYYIRIGKFLNTSGEIKLVAGVQAATSAAATLPATPVDTYSIGHVLLQRSGSTVSALANSSIFQYMGGGSGGSGSSTIGTQALLVSQTNTNLTDLSLLFSDNKVDKMEYSIVKNKRGISSFDTNSSISAKIGAAARKSVVLPDGSVILGGEFINYAGTTGRDYLVKFNADGNLDTAFNTNATDSAKFNGAVYSLALQSDGKILVGGGFTSYAGTSGRNRLIRLNSDGTVDSTFCTNASDGSVLVGDIWNITVISDGSIFIGGAFVSYKVAGRSYIAKLNADGTSHAGFNVNAVDGKFNSTVYSIIEQADNSILIAGGFINYVVSQRDRLIRVSANGILDTAFCTNAVDGSKISNVIFSMNIQFDGKILIGGNFINYAGTTGRNNLVRLNSDGTVDATFCTNASDGSKFNGTVYTTVPQPDGRIIVGGNITAYAGTSARNYLIRLNLDGTLDTAFCTSFTDSAKFSAVVYSVDTSWNGKLYVSGNFTSYQTAGRNRLASLVDTDLVEQGSLAFRYKTADSAWYIDGQTYTGDEAGVIFDITSGGQVRYTSDSDVDTPTEYYIKWSLTGL